MRDLNILRAKSAYPAFRFLCSILWIVAIGGGGIGAIVGLVVMIQSFVMGLGILFAAALSVFLAKVATEASLMLVDIADCTLDNWRQMPSASSKAPGAESWTGEAESGSSEFASA